MVSSWAFRFVSFEVGRDRLSFACGGFLFTRNDKQSRITRRSTAGTSSPFC